jgi:hypothetical protein
MEQSDQHQIGMHTRNYLPICRSHLFISYKLSWIGLMVGICVIEIVEKQQWTESDVFIQ